MSLGQTLVIRVPGNSGHSVLLSTYIFVFGAHQIAYGAPWARETKNVKKPPESNVGVM